MRKGFTLVETITSIIIISMIIIIAMPAYNGIDKTIKETTYNNKIKSIESATLKYANEYWLDEIKPEECLSNCFKCYELYNDIVAKGVYLAETTDDNDGTPKINNPITNRKLDGYIKLTFTIEDASLSAEFVTDCE
ncbi:MAG: prepilin-type N-terminal cleavage/methylation domain-containing protein [Bacilli bacterium]|nr:prepilin-type N-terminal cleavage/methylation domain-containing protein [Bacilli bacterium]MDD3895891.1 prepilin-type N-terminal cleavage/methylation domain-containing protein [Bacilli bacterium]MDD4407827.1 prepilin-type N-terminal cleavage/methylation domain-containing protein [Bacilli bacterium]